MIQTKISVSNTLILLSLFFTLLIYLNPIYLVYGMNNVFLDSGNYYKFLKQVLFFQFIHGGFFHFISNSIFLFIFGNGLENLIGKKRFLLFFIFSSIFLTIFIIIFSKSTTTIGISGFCMSLLAYYTLYLKSINNSDYKGGITAIIVNIGIGFIPGISFVGHLFGCIYGILFYFIDKIFKK